MPSRVYQTLEISRMIVLTVQTGIWLPTFGYQAYIKRIVLPASELVHFDRRCANRMESSCSAVNACVPMAVASFQHGFITEGDGIKYVFRNGTDTF